MYRITPLLSRPRFPAFRRSRDFLPAFRKVVIRWRDGGRSVRAGVPPALLLDTADEAFAHELLDMFAFMLGPGEMLVAHTGLRSARNEASGLELLDSLALHAGIGLDGAWPNRGGKLRLKTFRLMKDLTQRAQAASGEPEAGRLDGRAIDEQSLRDHSYALRADSGLIGVLTGLSRAEFTLAGGWLNRFWPVIGVPLFYTFPRWCWSLLWTRRLIRSRRSWFVSWRGIDRSGRFFQRMSYLLNLRDGDVRGQLETVEELLFRALLADLARARPRWISVWVRSSTPRRVLLLDLPPAGTQGEEPTHRFLATYMRTRAEAGSAELLLLGAGHAAPYMQENWTRCQNLNEAAHGLIEHCGDAPLPLVVSVEQPPVGEGLGELLHPIPVRGAKDVLQRKRITAGSALRLRPTQGADTVPDEQPRLWPPRLALTMIVLVLLGVGWVGLRSVLQSWQTHGHLAPGDAPAVVVSIVAISTAAGALIGTVLTAMAKWQRTKGQNESDLIRAEAERTRAQAEMIRAQADAVRAGHGLPSIEPSGGQAPDTGGAGADPEQTSAPDGSAGAA